MSTSVRAASLSCALLLVSVPGPARSETFCYSFTAAITGARSNLEFIGLPELEAGDLIAGSFTYDAGAPGVQESWGTIYQQPDLAITLHIDGVESSPSTREG